MPQHKATVESINTLPSFNIPYRSALLLTVHLQNVQAQRSELEIVNDVIARLGVKDVLPKMMKEVGGGRAILDPKADDLDDLEVQLAPQEIRLLIKTLNEITITVNDLVWINPLVKQFEKGV